MNTRNVVVSRMVCVSALLFCIAAGSPSGSDSAGKPVRIALMSDLHITRGTKDEQPFYKARLNQTIVAINAEHVDLVLIAGDLTENGTGVEFADLRKQLKQLQAPAWFVPGNHDLGGKVMPGKNDENTVTPERIGTFEWRLGPTWFSRQRAGVRVIGVNASLFGSGLRQEKAMWRFLEKELAAPAANPTLLLLHYPPFTKTPEEPGGVYWNIEPQPRRHLLELARQAGVRAVLSGHLHSESVQWQDGILFVTTPPVAYGLPKGRQHRGWTLLTISPPGEVHSEFRYVVD